LIKIGLESDQLEAGLGSISGVKFKSKFEEFYLKMSDIYIQDKFPIIAIATTCNCHGVINLFSLLPT
jgi:hypothetical protein